MGWLQLSITADKDQVETCEDLLLASGALSVTFTDAEDQPILEPEPGATPIWEHAVITALYDEDIDTGEVLTQLRQSLPDTEFTFEPLADQDWSRAWMDSFEAMPFGERLWVVPWHLEPPSPDAVNLRLDPGLAFGTGTHPTTSLCLKWLDANVRQGTRVLDYGCGSGILAIAALLLGAEHADGVDIDPQALTATADNARANGVEDRLTGYSVEDYEASLDDEQYDIVIANILSGPLIELSEMLAHHVKPGGQIVLSGILQEQAQDTLAAFASHLDMGEILIEEDWVLLQGHKQAPVADSTTQTQCPHCDTIFRLTQEQLTVANGKVRCGLCKEVFNALEAETPAEFSDGSSDDMVLAAQDENEPKPDAAESTDRQILEEESAAEEMPAEAEFSDAVSGDTGSPVSNDRYDTPEQEATAEDSEAQPEPVHNLFQDESSKLIPDEIRYDTDGSSRSGKAFWAASTLLLTLSLGAEYVWFHRDELSKDREWAPLVARFCDITGCELAAAREPDRIEMLNRNVYSHPNIDDALMISATMVNRADFPQAYPHLEVSFSNVRGEIVAYRVLTPAEYTGITERQLRELQPDRPVTFGIAIQDPGDTALTYAFEFL